MKTLPLIAICGILVGGCATQKVCRLNLDSYPSGAMLYHRGECVGRLPWRLDHAVTKEDEKASMWTLYDFSCKWPSGAEKKVPSYTFMLNGDLNRFVVLTHPGGKSSQYDHMMGVQYEQLNAMQAQAEAVNRQTRFMAAQADTGIADGLRQIARDLNRTPGGL